MTKDRILSYARELSTLNSRAVEITSMMDALNAQLAVAKAKSATEEAAKIISTRTEATNELTTVTKVATDKANRKDLAGVQRLLAQLEVRLDEHRRYEREYLTVEAQFEMAVAIGEFANEDAAQSRAEVEAVVNRARERMEKQLELASALVPEKPTLILV